MVVYVEYAFLENFILDALLLWLAVQCTRGKTKWLRLLLASTAGAVFAVVFPLIPMPVWAAYLVKGLSGALLAFLAAPKGIKACLCTAAAFFILTFVYGGLLTAAYSFFGVEHAEGNAYVVEQAPVSLVLCGAIVFAIAVVLLSKRFYRYRRLKRNLCECAICAGGKEVKWQGFCDSGNLLTFHERPVCVISPAGAFALFGKNLKSVGRITITTVGGARTSPVFACDCMKIGGREYTNVYLTVGNVPSKNYQIILHTSLLQASESEEKYEAVEPVAGIFKKNAVK